MEFVVFDSLLSVEKKPERMPKSPCHRRMRTVMLMMPIYLMAIAAS
jgi:hypothetical protein